MAKGIDTKSGLTHRQDVSQKDDHKDENDVASDGSLQDELTYSYSDSRKLGVTSSVFVILNKMIGTGIFSTPSGIFASTGSVGVCLFLWIIGGILTFAGLSVFLEFGLAVCSRPLSLCNLTNTRDRFPGVVERRTTSNEHTGIRSCS